MLQQVSVRGIRGLRGYSPCLFHSTVYGEPAGVPIECGFGTLLSGVAARVAFNAFDGVDEFLLHYLDGFFRECPVFSHRVENAVQQQVAAFLFKLFAVEGVAVVDAADGESHGAPVEAAAEIIGDRSPVKVGVLFSQPCEVRIFSAAVGENIGEYGVVAAGFFTEFAVECDGNAVRFKSSVGYP